MCVCTYAVYDEQITFIKAKCYNNTTSEQSGENGGYGFARNSESEKNERSNEISKEYVQIYMCQKNGFHKKC